jgi:hypothetical protein
MTSPLPRTGSRKEAAKILAAVLSLLLIPADTLLLAQQTAPAPAPSPAAEPEAVKLSADQLQALVAPIALYPDPLLAQVLVASTYPLDVVLAQQWLTQNAKLKGEELSKAAEQQSWDPSVQALVLLPDALKLLSENISWTKDLGDAFLAQQEDVMTAVQELRRRAKDDGKLETTEQQKVETTTEGNQTVVVIQPANPEVIYVPTYNPTVVWGAPYYPYPPIYYPPPYYGGAWLGFGMGVAIGIGISGGWGWGCGWGHNDIDINYNNNFVNNSNRNNNINRSGNGTWQHNAQQRGGVPYKDKATANKYGGGTRGASASNRQARTGSASRAPSAGTMDRGAGAGSTNRGASAGTRDRSAGAGATNRAAAGAGSPGSRGTSGSQVGSRNVPSSPRATSSSYGGSQSASRARSSSSRGSSSMSRGGSSMSRGGGGMSRGGGGGRGGGRR